METMTEKKFTDTVESLTARGYDRKAIIPETTVHFIGKCRACKKAYRHEVYYDACFYNVDYRGIRKMPAFRPVSRFSPKYTRECCGRSVLYKPVKGEHNPDQPCDGKCMSATGPSCSCSCGGANHGANHSS